MSYWEDYAINPETDDIYFDSKGDIAANYIDVSEKDRITQLTKDIYHLINVHEDAIINLLTDTAKINYIKALFVNDTRIKYFDVSINDNDITIENLELRQ
jgi:hypothetical protein